MGSQETGQRYTGHGLLACRASGPRQSGWAALHAGLGCWARGLRLLGWQRGRLPLPVLLGNGQQVGQAGVVELLPLNAPACRNGGLGCLQRGQVGDCGVIGGSRPNSSPCWLLLLHWHCGRPEHSMPWLGLGQGWHAVLQHACLRAGGQRLWDCWQHRR